MTELNDNSGFADKVFLSKAAFFVACFWFVSSGLAYGYGNADLFQRLGAVGVGLAAVVFLNLREKTFQVERFLLEGRLEYELRRADLSNLDRQIHMLRRMAFENPEEKQTMIEQLTNVREEYESVLDNKEALQSNLERLGRSDDSENVFLEVAVVLLATLQWGFGDLVVFGCPLCSA